MYPAGPDRSQVRISGALVAGALAVVALVLVLGGVDFSTEWLWFDSLGLASVFLTTVSARLALFAVGASLFLVFFVANVVVARRLAYGFEVRPRRATMGGPWEDLLAQVGAQMARRGDYARLINVAVLVGGLLLALFMGLLATGNWLVVLQFLHRSSFEIPDPAFGQDVGFYLFVMPVLRAAEGWLFMALLLIGLSALAVYAVVLTYELAVNIGQVRFPLSRGLRGHLLCLAAIAFALIAFHHVLDMFDLVRSTRGVAYGAGYTDYHVQRPAQVVLAVGALLASVLCLGSIGTAGFRLAILGGGLWAGLVVGAWLIPSVFQGVDVVPNELDRERPWIAANILFTNQAFGLDRIEARDIAFEEAVPPTILVDERETINNIRLWDHRPLKDTYKQIQAIRQYYLFEDVDVDRYIIDGEYRQVMVAARELAPEQLPREAQTWVTRQLQYTHGYGVAMSPVNVVSQEGLPELVIQDVPPLGRIPITRPEIYFGEKTDHYVITRTSTPEFDYPSGDAGVFAPRYGADTGVDVGSLPRRLLFAVKFQDPNFVLNSSFQPDSQLLYRRHVTARARQIAPFLRLDPDPYIVVADGALYWIQDAYTVSDRYPYSQPYPGDSGQRRPRQRPFNYMRNSVKIVTSAYDGSIRFFVADPSDPLIQSYQRIFPALFVPQDQAPKSIRDHFRYPEGLFRIQAEVYKQYHVQDPRTFYLREDLWTIPNELFYDQRQPVDPYYVIMKLPGQARPEFILMLPFTPGNKDNMVGWLAARSDEPDYGKMVVYKYPKDKVIFGPFQLETRIDQDPTISAQFSLWNQAGSQVIRGNLLVIPIGQSNLYVEPIYLQATASPLPELKRVIVATGNRIVMESTLEDGLARLFGAPPGVAQAPQRASAVPSQRAAPETSPSALAQLASEAQDRFHRAQEALRAADFARYGEELRGLEETLNRLVQESGAR